MLEVKLAGFNLDAEVIKELQEKGSEAQVPITPEPISAAYARISRSPSPVNELRAGAREEVDKARKSNRTIIFEMGHYSVAEHSVFNFDVIGISRLGIEALEGFRLASYTEKSQRYITLKGDFIIPKEIKDLRFVGEFVELINIQNGFYRVLFEELKKYHAKVNPSLAENKRDLASRAKEDARYVVSLATQGQLGMTVNARELELMIRRFASHPLAEVRDLGRQLYEEAKSIAPSLLLFCEANDFDEKTYSSLREFTKILEISHEDNWPKNVPRIEVSLLDFTSDADNKVLAALLHRVSNLNFDVCTNKIQKLTKSQKLHLIKRAFEHAELYDAALREFEHVYLTFELLTSATEFAQLKRHRMATLSPQGYDLNLGFTIPEPIRAIRRKKDFERVMEKSSDLYKKIMLDERRPQTSQYIAEYALTNAHKRRVLVTMNARELYHFTRLRCDEHAQWEIRNHAHQMLEMAKEKMPLTALLAGGKDAYVDMYKKIYGKTPKVIEAKLPRKKEIPKK